MTRSCACRLESAALTCSPSIWSATLRHAKAVFQTQRAGGGHDAIDPMARQRDAAVGPARLRCQVVAVLAISVTCLVKIQW